MYHLKCHIVITYNPIVCRSLSSYILHIYEDLIGTEEYEIKIINLNKKLNILCINANIYLFFLNLYSEGEDGKS